MKSIFLSASLVLAFAISAPAVFSAELQKTATDSPSTTPLSPAESLKRFVTPDDLRIELVASEPVVRQPVFLNFDERGRMWVVQYLQYPDPRGLKVLSHDGYWRAVYDKVPDPPPRGYRGADKITILEDTRGNGVFDRVTMFVDGLNIATAVARGRGGAWVLNPPYLLFYPLNENEDSPSGPPEVRLSGFGLEDTHSVVNSLCWGPDGWLYAAQGSTVTGNVLRPGDKQSVHTVGQLIWRYHPARQIYEIFAEGGGNTFGVEFDAVGRLYSGHNGGDTRGFAYVQGGYFQKTFGKHGDLSNPYAFGYFPAMKSNKTPRFTHTFKIYEAEGLPEAYHGKLFGISPLQHHVVLSDVLRDGSSMQTKDLSFPVTTTDNWFTPVDIKLGPDAALYIADWHDAQCTHTRSEEGKINRDTGRIYRLAAKDAKPIAPFNLAKLPTAELIEQLRNSNPWFRQTALRLLGDRKDKTAIPTLTRLIDENRGQLALEALWALNLSGGLNEAAAIKTLKHENPYVRLWTVRLLCDEKIVSPKIAEQLVAMARTEPDVEVRSQLACSARRLPVRDDLAIVRPLLGRSEDAVDIHMPLLLWWAIEAQAADYPHTLIEMFQESAVWDLPLVRQHILERLMRRFAATGRQKDLLVCAQLLKQSPNAESTKCLMRGFEAALAGKPLPHLPDELAKELESYSKTSIVFGLRQGRKAAIEEALATLGDPKGDRNKQLQYLQILSEVPQPDALPVLLKVFERRGDDALFAAALTALQRYDDPSIGAAVVAAYPQLSADLCSSAQTMLASRSGWTRRLLTAVEENKIDSSTITPEVASQFLRHHDEKVDELVHKYWGELKPPTSRQLQTEIERVGGIVRAGGGVPKEGRTIFNNQCAKCHTLFGRGGQVGPDLTAYQRDNLDHILMAVINPSAEIREGFTTYLVSTKDGRALSGLLVDQDPQSIMLRTADGRDTAIARDDIEEMTASKVSLMPEGLLKGMSDQQLRDLFAFVRMTQPLVDK